MKRTANAQWRGDLKSGHGAISTASGVLADAQYSFSTRFEEGKGTNPEELIAAVAPAGAIAQAKSGLPLALIPARTALNRKPRGM